jgi:hypothetical protein
MAVESGEQRDPSSARSGETRHQGERDPADRAASRRRIIITSLLAPPAVMTLKARSARAGHPGRHDTASCTASATAHPGTSHHCT